MDLLVFMILLIGSISLVIFSIMPIILKRVEDDGKK